MNIRHVLIAAVVLLPTAAAATNFAPEPAPAPAPAPAPEPEPAPQQRSEPADRSNQCDSTYGVACDANGPSGGVTVQSTTPKRTDRHMIQAEDYRLVLNGYTCNRRADLEWWCVEVSR